MEKGGFNVSRDGDEAHTPHVTLGYFWVLAFMGCGCLGWSGCLQSDHVFGVKVTQPYELYESEAGQEDQKSVALK